MGREGERLEKKSRTGRSCMALGGERDTPAMLAFSPSRVFKVTSQVPIGQREPPDRG